MNTSDQLDLFEDQTQYSTSFKQLEIEYIIISNKTKGTEVIIEALLCISKI